MNYEIVSTPQSVGQMRGNTDGWSSVYVTAVNSAARSGRRIFNIQELWVLFCLQTRDQVVQ
jgi:hypothetical protein